MNGSTTYFAYDGNQLVLDWNPGSSTVHTYAYGPTGLLSRGPGAAYLYTFDPLGSLAEDIDASADGGRVTVYDAYGENYYDSKSVNGDAYGLQDQVGFSGQWGAYTDLETADSSGTPQVLMGARYYDPISARFTSRDPLGDDVNDYTYCGDNPVENADPSGMTYYDAANAFQQYRQDITSVAKQYGIQPELLGGAVYREQYAGGKPSLWKDMGSRLFFLLGTRKAFGIGQVHIDPKTEPGCKTVIGRARFLANYTVVDQLRRSAKMLSHLARRRYKDRAGNLSTEEMGIVLTEYNRGETFTPNDKARPSADYGCPAMRNMPEIKRWLNGDFKGVWPSAE